jgi:hypothetical protein
MIVLTGATRLAVNVIHATNSSNIAASLTKLTTLQMVEAIRESALLGIV